MNAILVGVDARDKGAIPVSIGTSLAVEAACGVYPERPVSPAPLMQVKEVWFNIRTLVRNLIGALPSDIKDHITPPHLLPALMEEMGILESAVAKGSNGMARVVYYCCDYTPISRKFSKAVLKTPKTDKQVMQFAIEEKTVLALLKESLPFDIRTFRYELIGKFPASFIVTHLPIDLLSKYSFAKLELLESHTGKIKPWAQWNTKLTNGKELPNIPFNSFTLQVFGDNGNHFSPMLPSLKKEVLRLAEEDRWTAITTDEKIRASLRKIANPTERTVLMSLL